MYRITVVLLNSRRKGADPHTFLYYF